MKQCSKLLALALGLAMPAGCTLEVRIPVHTSEIASVAEKGNPVDIKLEIHAPIPGVDKCDEYGPKAVKSIEGAFRNIEFQGCAKEGEYEFARLLVSSSVAPETNAPPYPDALALVVKKETLGTEAGFTVYLSQNTGAAKRLVKKVEEGNSGAIDEIRLVVSLDNDQTSSAMIVAGGVFWNDLPVQENKSFSLQRGDQARIGLSNVASKALLDDQQVRLFHLAK